MYTLLALLSAIIAWIFGVFGGFAIAGIVLTIFKRWLIREREYSKSYFTFISRGSLVIPLVFSYIFLPKAGFVGWNFYLSFLVIGYFIGVCFGRPVLLRSFSNILESLSYYFISKSYQLRGRKIEKVKLG